MKAKHLTISDCVEISCAISDENIAEKIGCDGADLAAGNVVLSRDELIIINFSVTDKLERLREGFYDEYPGEYLKPRSCTGAWIRHMENIRRKLTVIAGEL